MAGTIDGDTAGLDSGRLGARVEAVRLQARSSTVPVGFTIDVSLRLGAEISSIDIGLFTVPGTESGLDKLLVSLEHRLEFRDGNIVEEDTFSKLAIWYSESLLAISSLSTGYISRTSESRAKSQTWQAKGNPLDSLGSNADELVVE